MASARILVVALVVLAVFAATATACDTPVNEGVCTNCTTKAVLAYARLDGPYNTPTYPNTPPELGTYFHFGLDVVKSGNGYKSGSYVGNQNWEFFYFTSDATTGSGKPGYSISDNLVPDSVISAAGFDPKNIAGAVHHCCQACAAVPGCYYYAFYPLMISTPLTGMYAKNGATPDTGSNQVADMSPGSFSFNVEYPARSDLPAAIGRKCYLLNKAHGLQPKDYAFDGDANPGHGKNNPKAIVGGTCNPNVADDPHLVGARGTKYDFNGGLAQPYCLITDKNMHVNVFLDGYKDNKTTTGSTKGLRTWIKEVGMIWRHEGVEHKAHLVARRGKQQERGDGFLKSVTVDGVPVEIPALGKSVAAPGNFKLTFESQDKKHIFDMDHFTVSAGSVVDMDVRMRVAHPNLQTPEDAQTHFNLGFTLIENTPAVHGVLGQTYREGVDQQQRVTRFRALAKSLNGPLVADGEVGAGKGFLDGETKDYVSSSILSADCHFSAFHAADTDNLVKIAQVVSQ